MKRLGNLNLKLKNIKNLKYRKIYLSILYFFIILYLYTLLYIPIVEKINIYILYSLGFFFGLLSILYNIKVT